MRKEHLRRGPSARVALLGLFALALVVRCAVVLADSGYEPRNDAFDYDRHAVSIAARDGYPQSVLFPGGGPTALRPPAYPSFLAAVYRVSGDSVTAGRLAGALLGAVAALLIYSIVASIWGRRAGLAAGALGAVYPPLVLLSRELFTENLYIVLLLLSVWLVLRYRGRRELRWAAAAGAVVGLALLTRNAALSLLVPVVIGLWGRPAGRWRAFAAPALALACTALVLAPWTVRNAIEFGRFIPIASSSGVTLAGTYNATSRDDSRFPAGWRNPAFVPQFAPLYATAGIDEASFDRQLREEALDFAGGHPGYVVEASAHNLLRMFMLEHGAVVTSAGEVTVSGIGNRGSPAEGIGLAIVALLAAMGVAAIVSEARRRRADPSAPPGWPAPGPLFLWLIPLLAVATAAPLGGLPRYRLPADPFLIMAAGIGLIWGWDRISNAIRTRRKHVRSVAAAGAALLMFGVLAGCGGGDDDSEPASGTQSATEPQGETISKEEYVDRANAVCRKALAETRRLRDKLATEPIHVGGGGPEAALTKAIIVPSVRLLDRTAAELRALPPPDEDSATPAAYVGLFDVEAVLQRERLRLGLKSGLAESAPLQRLALEAAAEQQELARSYGMRDCDVDYRQELFPSTTG